MTPVLTDPRLIVGLDLPSLEAARAMVDRLGATIRFYKVGLTLLARPGGVAFAHELRASGKSVFQDWKLHDIGAQVEGAARSVAEGGCDLLTVHAHPQVMRAADLVIVPLPPSPLSARAFEVVVEEVRGHGKGHPPILPVLSMLDLRRGLHRAAREANPAWPAIPLASAVELCAVERRPVGAFAPRSPAARAMTGLWAAIEKKLASRASGK